MMKVNEGDDVGEDGCNALRKYFTDINEPAGCILASFGRQTQL